MSHYHHFSIIERESLLIMREKGYSIRQMARELGRSPSSISREFKRNMRKQQNPVYSPSTAQNKYNKRRKASRRKKRFEDKALWDKVRKLIVEKHWSPEQISGRLEHEKNPLQVSCTTIYRAINKRVFDTQKVTKKKRGFKRNLRHKGKHRHVHGRSDNRGGIQNANSIDERPQQANERTEVGHWEADTVVGTLHSGAILTLVDRKSRFLMAAKLQGFSSSFVADVMTRMLKSIPLESVKTVTPDMGFEFRNHADVSSAINGLLFYFAHPHSPWERGTNENTNGLLREYFPKSTSFAEITDDLLAPIILQINLRPRKCLGWKSPFEIFFSKVLHLA